MSAEHLFISDVHLGSHQPKIEKKIEGSLIQLINYATENKARLYVLGDLFDYWMEFPNSDFVPDISPAVLNAFERYNNDVAPCLYLTGNHDNWTFGYFESLGFDVEPEFRQLEIFGKKLFLMHGDGLWTIKNSLKRPLLHRILRSKLFLAIYQSLFSEKIAIDLMRRFSNSTRKIERVNTVTLNRNAETILNRTEIDLVLCGHDHIPRVETFNSGLYINLGTFFHHGTLVRGFENSFDLVHWNTASNTFNTFEKHHLLS